MYKTLYFQKCFHAGCPCALHLVGVGIGRIGIVDYDKVELSNLHRQLLHEEDAIGKPKVESAKKALSSRNHNVTIDAMEILIDSNTALDIIRSYDVVIDCTDNVATRYLLNDACVLLRKPLVSGSALQFEGQLTVYNWLNGPCYRCLFPIPPSPASVTNCGESGVMATVTGVIGAMQATEAVKLILENGKTLNGRLLVYDAMEASFRNIKLRGRKTNCEVCSNQSTITKLIDYEQFCGMKANDTNPNISLLNPEMRMSVLDYKQMNDNNIEHILIDVRSAIEFEICHLPTAINIPIKSLLKNSLDDKFLADILFKQNVVVVCRRGNDSQLAVQQIRSLLPTLSFVKDIIGGLYEWTRQIDSHFPIY